MMAVKRLVRPGIALLACVLYGCSDSSGPSGPSALQGTDVPATAPVGSVVSFSVTVVDSRERPVANVSVSFEASGGGSVSIPVATTTATGQVSPGVWTMGTQPGTNTLRATAAGVPALTVTVQTTVDAPSAIQPVAGLVSTGTVGQALAVAPAVTLVDRFGNPVAGAQVTFTVTGGTLTGATQTTDAAGVARAAGWQLATIAGSYSWTARSGQVTRTFPVDVSAGPPAAMQITAGTAQRTLAGQNVAVRPSVNVRDQYGNAARFAPVSFTVTAGGGSVTGGSTTTDAGGLAVVQSWRLGNAPGENVLSVATPGLAAVTVTAIGEAMMKLAGDSTSCPVNSTGCSFTVRVINAAGGIGAGETVVWTGSDGATATSTANSNGFATASNLGMNASVGQFTQTARLQFSGDETTFAYSLVQGGGYNIDLRISGDSTPVILAAFEEARLRWQEIITGSLPGGLVTLEANACGLPHPAVNEVVDDLLILVSIVEIDGPGNILGAAGPCLIRNSNNLPVLGIIRLDVADLALMQIQGILRDVILHEIGHVIGLGALWRPDFHDVVQGRGTSDPRYFGARGVSGFILGGGPLFSTIPVENLDGPGSADTHWREAALANELMTSRMGAGPNPLSVMTIGALLDMGYQVNFGVADPYTVPSSVFQSYLRQDENAVRLIEMPLPPPRRW